MCPMHGCTDTQTRTIVLLCGLTITSNLDLKRAENLDELEIIILECGTVVARTRLIS